MISNDLGFVRVGENSGNITHSFSAKQKKNNNNLRNYQILCVFLNRQWEPHRYNFHLFFNKFT